MKFQMSRRAVLRGAHGAALSLPLLQAMGDRAYAAPPLRFVVFFHHQGTFDAEWRPKTTGPNPALPKILEPLKPFADKVTIISGLSNRAYDRIDPGGDAHGTAAVSIMTANSSVDPKNRHTGAASASIDQELGTRLRQDRRFASLNLSVGLPGKPVFWSGPGRAAEKENDPSRVLARLLTDPKLGKPPPMTTPTLRQRILARRAPMMDLVADSYRKLSPRLGKEDRALMEAHLAYVEQLTAEDAKRNMDSPPAPACMQRDLGLPAKAVITDRDQEPAMSRAQTMNAVMALACEQTRVVTILHAHEDFQNFNWLNLGLPGPYENWHAVIHQTGGTKQAEMIRAMTWYTERFAFLLEQLQATKEGDGTLLDNTVVLWMSDFGDGSRHQNTDLPVVIAGGPRNLFPGGRHLNLRGRTTNELYSGILHAFGYDDARFGLADAAFNQRPLTFS